MTTLATSGPRRTDPVRRTRASATSSRARAPATSAKIHWSSASGMASVARAAANATSRPPTALHTVGIMTRVLRNAPTAMHGQHGSDPQEADGLVAGGDGDDHEGRGSVRRRPGGRSARRGLRAAASRAGRTPASAPRAGSIRRTARRRAPRSAAQTGSMSGDSPDSVADEGGHDREPDDARPEPGAHPQPGADGDHHPGSHGEPDARRSTRRSRRRVRPRENAQTSSATNTMPRAPTASAENCRRRLCSSQRTAEEHDGDDGDDRRAGGEVGEVGVEEGEDDRGDGEQPRADDGEHRLQADRRSWAGAAPTGAAGAGAGREPRERWRSPPRVTGGAGASAADVGGAEVAGGSRSWAARRRAPDDAGRPPRHPRTPPTRRPPRLRVRSVPQRAQTPPCMAGTPCQVRVLQRGHEVASSRKRATSSVQVMAGAYRRETSPTRHPGGGWGCIARRRPLRGVARGNSPACRAVALSRVDQDGTHDRDSRARRSPDPRGAVRLLPLASRAGGRAAAGQPRAHHHPGDRRGADRVGRSGNLGAAAGRASRA